MIETIKGQATKIGRLFVNRIADYDLKLDRVEFNYGRNAPFPEIVIRGVQIGSVTVFPKNDRHFRASNEPWCLQFGFPTMHPWPAGAMLTLELDVIVLPDGRPLDYFIDVHSICEKPMRPGDKPFKEYGDQSTALARVPPVFNRQKRMRRDLGDCIGPIPYDSGVRYLPESFDVVGDEYDMELQSIRRQPPRSLLLDERDKKRLAALAAFKRDKAASAERAREIARPLDEAPDAAWESPSWEEP